MKTANQGYWGRLWAALKGGGATAPRAEQPAPLESPPGDDQAAACRARVAVLEMEQAERQRQIEQMRLEYAALERRCECAHQEAGQAQIERLCKKLAWPLANLSALMAMSQAGREIEVGDLLELIKGLQKELARVGLEPVGRAGERTVFDVARHQRMSGGAVDNGTPVTVQVPGYSLAEKVLLKAMVSTREA